MDRGTQKKKGSILNKTQVIDYEPIAKVLFANFETIYDIDAETSAYKVFHESEDYKKLELRKSGDDFFSEIAGKINEMIVPEDRQYVFKMLKKDNLIEGLDREKYYSFMYRIQNKGKNVYHKVRATYQPTEEGMHIFLGVRNIDSMMKRENAHREEIFHMKQELQMSRTKNFTDQMQPHFLYNALGSIQEMILIDPDRASDLLGDFILHMRGFIRAATSDKPVAFSQELENIRAYVNIEKMRMGERLRVHYDTEALDFEVMPLTIQPLVENAVRHGIYARGKAGGDVYIRTREEEKEWIVRVEDNGAGFDIKRYRELQKAGEGDSSGLRNISYRLERVMGAVLDIKSCPGKGTSAVVRIPKGGSE